MAPAVGPDQLNSFLGTGEGGATQLGDSAVGNFEKGISDTLGTMSRDIDNIGKTDNQMGVSGSQASNTEGGAVGGLSNIIGSLASVADSNVLQTGADEGTLMQHGQGLGSQEQRELSAGGTIKSALSGGLSGAQSGMAFGPYGAVAGGIIGLLGGVGKGLTGS
jgi:hypothetical protein